jgi:hypothetical protein
VAGLGYDSLLLAYTDECSKNVTFYAAPAPATASVREMMRAPALAPKY